MHLSSLKHRIQKIYITNSHNVKRYKSYYYYFKFMNKPFLVGQIVLQAVIQECLRITLLGKCMQVQAHTHTHAICSSLSLSFGLLLWPWVSFHFLFPGTLTPSLRLAFLLSLKPPLTHLWGEIQLAHRASVCYVWTKKRRLCAIAMISSWKKRGKGKVISLAAELMVNVITLSSSALAMLVL